MQIKPDMKCAFILLIVLLPLLNCQGQLSVIELKDYKSIEGIKIGMPIISALDILKRKYFILKTEKPDYEGENNGFEYIVYLNDSKKVILFSLNPGGDVLTKDKVFSISIKHSRYQTPNGVFIGMTIKDLKQKDKLESAHFNYDDGFIILSGKFNGGYLMDINTIKDNYYNFEEPEINSLPEELAIKEIMMY